MRARERAWPGARGGERGSIRGEASRDGGPYRERADFYFSPWAEKMAFRKGKRATLTARGTARCCLILFCYRSGLSALRSRAAPWAEAAVGAGCEGFWVGFGVGTGTGWRVAECVGAGWLGF